MVQEKRCPAAAEQKPYLNHRKLVGMACQMQRTVPLVVCGSQRCSTRHQRLHRRSAAIESSPVQRREAQVVG